MKALNPQASTVLNHLRTKGSISSWEAEGVYRIRRLASRIDELRAAGYEIETQTKEDASGQRYTRYFLSKRQRRAKRPLLPGRAAPKQFRIDRITALYRDYCVRELSLSGTEATEEVEEFTKFIKDNA